MKKIILLALSALMMGCNDEKVTYEVTDNYGIVVIDSCEYITGTNKLAHKGNCRFCKERRQKEMKELIE